MDDGAAGRAQTPPMFFATPSTKEQTMKRIATTVVVAVVACLAFASIASAHRGARSHANVAPGPCLHHARPAAHAAAKASQARLARASHLHHRAAY